MTPRRIIVDGTKDGCHQLVIIDGLEVWLSPNRFHVFEMLALARYLDQDDEGWLEPGQVWYTPADTYKLLYKMRKSVHRYPPMRVWRVYETDRKRHCCRLDARPISITFLQNRKKVNDKRKKTL